jgi:hypothetical protein
LLRKPKIPTFPPPSQHQTDSCARTATKGTPANSPPLLVVEGPGAHECARRQLRDVEALEEGLPEDDVLGVRRRNDGPLVVRLEGRVQERRVALLHPAPEARRLVCEVLRAVDPAVREEGAEAARVQVVEQREKQVLINAWNCWCRMGWERCELKVSLCMLRSARSLHSI